MLACAERRFRDGSFHFQRPPLPSRRRNFKSRKPKGNATNTQVDCVRPESSNSFPAERGADKTTDALTTYAATQNPLTLLRRYSSPFFHFIPRFFVLNAENKHMVRNVFANSDPCTCTQSVSSFRVPAIKVGTMTVGVR